MKQKIDTYKDHRGIVRAEKAIKAGKTFTITSDHFDTIMGIGNRQMFTPYQRGFRATGKFTNIK